MKEWRVVVSRNGKMIDIGSVMERAEPEARLGALYKYSITEDERKDHIETKDDLEVLGILEDDDFSVFAR